MHLSRGLALLVVASPLIAQAPPGNKAQPERPTVATHAGTVAKGWWEIEAGGEYDRFADHSHGFAAPTLFKFLQETFPCQKGGKK